MIKITKGPEPKILADNKDIWTEGLMKLIKKYGSYGDIPKNEKDAAIKHYSHPDIVAALKGTLGNTKCIYCESYVDVTCFSNIEHFHPKSVSPDETFDWDNLFVGCTVCNTPKNSFNTSKEPFIHPVNDNPEDYLTFDDLVYIPKAKKGLAYQKAKKVIDNCKLERIPLAREHASIQFAFMSNKEALRKKVELYNGRKSDSLRFQDAVEIYTSLVGLDKEACDEAEYAGYMRYLLRKHDVVKDAVAIVDKHRGELGIPDGFHWSFIF